ncbi:MAG: BTAD domain-containing putative transcriptional regulator [Gemmatimonadales bacterium]
MTYSLRLLGGISLDGPDGPLTGKAVQPRQSALLAVLAAAQDKGISRDKAVGLLWPESDRVEARHALSNSVYEIRKELGEEAVLASGGNLRLNSHIVWTDIGAFGEALGRGDLAGAVDAYGGPFLDGFHLSGAKEFEDWVESERQRLSVQYAEALESLAESAEQSDDFPRAVGWWQRLVAYDPYNSRFAVRLMQAMAVAGDPANALQYAQEHEQLLRRELDIDPPEDLLALAERLRREGVPSKPTSAVGPVDVEATSEGARGAAPSTSSYETGRRYQVLTWRNAGLSFLAVLAASAAVIAGRNLLGGGEAETNAVTEERPSLAVLPFLNRSGLEEDRYFTDGIHDEILTQLSKIGGLSVRGRTSVLHYRDTQKTLRQIGEELNARYILGGGVQRAGPTVRINVQLADIRSDEQIWAETYDRPLTVENLLGVQSEIALQVAEVLKTTLTPEETRSVLSQPTDNLEAYNSYLLGRFAWTERTGAGLARAIDHFEAAIELDSLYAPAYAGLADCYNLLPYYTDWLPEQVFPRAATLASLALERDSTLAEAYISLARVKETYYWDRGSADTLYRRGIRLSPNYATGHHWYGGFLSRLGRHDEAVEELRRAQELDPFSVIINRNLADELYYARRYDQAIEQYEHTFQLDSTFIGIAEHRGKAYLLLGRFEDAVRQLEAARSSYLGAPYLLAYAYAVSGYEEEARRMLQSLIEQEHIPLHSWFLALVYSGLGDNDLAFEYLERALSERDPRMSYLKTEPFLDNLRSDPRYTALLTRLGLD